MLHWYTYIIIYIYIYTHVYAHFWSQVKSRSRPAAPANAPILQQLWTALRRKGIHPVSIAGSPLRIFSPGAGLLRNAFVHR